MNHTAQQHPNQKGHRSNDGANKTNAVNLRSCVEINYDSMADEIRKIA